MDTIQLSHTPDTEATKHEKNRDKNGKFLPGMSGNPNGRPKRNWTWTDLLVTAAEEFKTTKTLGKLQVKELVAKRLLAEAINGNIQAIKEVMNRMDGMPQQDITSNGEAIDSSPTVIIKTNEQ